MVKSENTEEYGRIFERYLEICNEAIEKNKDKFPYADIWRARQKKLGQQITLQCAVYDDRPKVIYTLQLTEDMKIKILAKKNVSLDEAWPFKFSYLKSVVKNPQKYIEHPANLDWAWLDDVFG